MTIEIEPQAENILTERAKSALGIIFRGAVDPTRICVIGGNRLREKESYAFSNGLLIIDGNIPQETKLTVTNGKLYINGDMLAGSSASVQVPQEIEIRKVPYSAQIGFMQYATRFHESPFVKGPAYIDDHDPALFVTGSADANVKLASNQGIRIGRSFSQSVSFTDTSGSNIQMGNAEDLFIWPIVREKLDLHT